MDDNHELEWYYNKSFDWKRCKKVKLTAENNELTYEALHEACGELYEIQRVCVEMKNGFSLTIQSPTKNKVNINPHYVTLAQSVRRRSAGVYEFRSFTFRTDFVQSVTIWIDYPPAVRILGRDAPDTSFVTDPDRPSAKTYFI